MLLSQLFIICIGCLINFYQIRVQYSVNNVIYMPKSLYSQSASSSQQEFVRQSIAHNIRIDGRSNLTKRSPIIKTNVLPHLIGSSYVFYEYEPVEVYTGLKLKLQKIDNGSITDENIPVNYQKRIILDVSAMAKLNEQQLEQVSSIKNILTNHYIAKLLDKKGFLSKFLEIPKAKKHYLSLHIDVFLLGTIHLSSLELIVSGIRQALLSMKTSRLQPTINQITDEETIQVMVDQQINFQSIFPTKQDLSLDPIMISLEIVGVYISSSDKQSVLNAVFDLRKEEYESVDACLLVQIVNIDRIGHIQTLQGVISIQNIGKIARTILAQNRT